MDMEVTAHKVEDFQGTDAGDLVSVELEPFQSVLRIPVEPKHTYTPSVLKLAYKQPPNHRCYYPTFH